METKSKLKNVHIGRKISHIRELRGMKQDTLAFELGISQQTVSKIEQSEKIDDDLLEQIAKVLGVPADGIRNFSEEAVFNIIGNTVTNNDNGALFNYFPTFNPIDKLLDVLEENRKLYERLLQSEQEKVKALQSSQNS